MKRRILAVIVLYKISVEESASYRSLLQAAQHVSSDLLDLLIILHDNTPGASAPAGLPANVIFAADANNSGLAKAYNNALGIAVEDQYDWLLTLDQDTELPVHSLDVFLSVIAQIGERADVGAIVPRILAGGRTVSPHYFAKGVWPRWFPAGFNGIPEQTVYAFNSGSLVNVAALAQVGGYSPWFWLDNSDSWLYKQLSKFGKRVYVAGLLELGHDFSMLNMQERVSPQRYKNILIAESAFWDLEMNVLAGLERTARLLVRVLKHWIRNDSKELRRLTLEALWLRLFRTRTYRVARWRSITREQLGPALVVWKRPAGPKISVCMAAYNGERYIEAQLRSIVSQLGAADEIVIVDDGSQDGTLQIIRPLQEELASHSHTPKILLIPHAEKKGLASTFEDAVRSATGDLLFLCDDHDLWMPDTVSKAAAVFGSQSAVQVIRTGIVPIDKQGEPVEDPEWLGHHRGRSEPTANPSRNQSRRSLLAFRSSLLRHILPFPAGQLFLHGAWIGTGKDMLRGDTFFIDEPLVRYRMNSAATSRAL